MLEKEQLFKYLERIREQNEGILRARDVVEAARDAASPIHDYFEWDDKEAADEYRLWQARRLVISVKVVIERPEPKTLEIPRIEADSESKELPAYRRAFVSLSNDRKEDGGGYRRLEDVLNDDASREELLEQAKRDMRKFQFDYQQLVELAEVFSAMERVL